MWPCALSPCPSAATAKGRLVNVLQQGVALLWVSVFYYKLVLFGLLSWGSDLVPQAAPPAHCAPSPPARNVLHDDHQLARHIDPPLAHQSPGPPLPACNVLQRVRRRPWPLSGPSLPACDALRQVHRRLSAGCDFPRLLACPQGPTDSRPSRRAVEVLLNVALWVCHTVPVPFGWAGPPNAALAQPSGTPEPPVFLSD